MSLVLDLCFRIAGPSRGGGGPAVYNISTRDTEANIQATSPSYPSGSVTLAFWTDKYDLYVWDGTDWYKYNNI